MGLSRRRKQKTIIIGILKDKASLAKAVTLHSPARSAVIRATPHGDTSPPPEHRLAGACADVFAARLRGTRCPAVALKCLGVAHSGSAANSSSPPFASPRPASVVELGHAVSCGAWNHGEVSLPSQL